MLYALAHPSPDCSGEIRYIGMTTVGLGERMKQHMVNARGGLDYPVYRWMRKLMERGVVPEMCDMGPGGPFDEMALVAHQRSIGARLLNCTAGGDGGRSPSKETIAKLRAANLGKKHSPESSEKKRIAMLGNTHTLGRRLSPEHRAKVGLASLGNKRAAVPRTEEWKLANSKRMLGNKHLLGYRFSDEAKAKLSEAVKASIARRWPNGRPGPRNGPYKTQS